MKKTIKICELILIIILIVTETFLILKKEFQNDTFYSIKVGEYLSHNGISSLNIDVFSWHENLSYCNPHWLNDVIIYFSFFVGNYVGVYILTLIESIVLGALIFYISYKESNNKWVSCVITLLMIYLLQSFLAARAQLISYIIFILEVYFIRRYIDTNKRRYIGGLLILALLLANIHMAVFPIYFVLFLPYIVKDIIANIFFKENRKILFNKIEITKSYKLKSLIIICIVAALIGLINPSGFTPFTYTAKIMQGTTMNYINEHAHVDFEYLRFNKPYLIVYFLVILILFYPKEKVNLEDIFMLIGLCILSFIGVRQLALLISISSSILSKYISRVKENFLSLKVFKGERFIFLRVLSTFIIIFTIFYGAIKYYKKFGIKNLVNEKKYPVKAAEWIKENLDLNTLRLYNNYSDGSYLILVGIPDFVDTRCDLFTAEFNKELEKGADIFADSMEVQETSNYEKVFEKYGINACLVNKNEFTLNKLENDDMFENVYEDENYMVYIKKELK